MNIKLESAQYKFLDSIGNICDSYGLNRFVAQLYAYLYLSDEPLSLDEMVEKLKVSKGSVSVYIRELEKWGAVKKVWVKGSRKDYYEANLDIKRVIIDKIKSGIEKRVSEISKMIEEFEALIETSGGPLTEEERRVTKVYEDRLDKIKGLKDFVQNGLNVAGKFFL